MTLHCAIERLSPQAVWQSFVALNAVPRPSKKEEKVIAFMRNFGTSLGLETLQDATGNVLIRKPASVGMAHKPWITLQSHLDMVHQKNKETVFNFETQGIQMEIKGDWVAAKGTTLGADNGMGVAAIMALLQATDIAHGPLEALFTIDEETGMTGAKGLAPNWLKGKYLLNLDTEDDDEIAIGCAGGIDITAQAQFKSRLPEASAIGFVIKISGLQGGHSGMDIHKGYGNANVLMNSMLLCFCERFAVQLCTIHGGSLRNAIPRESVVEIYLPVSQAASFKAFAANYIEQLIKEWRMVETGLTIFIEKIENVPTKAMNAKDSLDLCTQISRVHNGVYARSKTVPDLVETSNNVAIVTLFDGKFELACLCRSAVEQAKLDLADAIKTTFNAQQYHITLSGDYPGWAPKPEGVLLGTLRDLYVKLFKEKPRVVACHAGLECGLLGQHYPAMEMISFGPNIRGAHSPDEKVSIASVQKFWTFLLAVLQHID